MSPKPLPSSDNFNLTQNYSGVQCSNHITTPQLNNTTDTQFTDISNRIHPQTKRTPLTVAAELRREIKPNFTPTPTNG